MFDTGDLDALIHHIGGNRVVQVHGNPFVQHNGHVGKRTGDQRRHQDSHMTLVFFEHVFLQQAAQDQRSHQRLSARNIVPQRVRQLRLKHPFLAVSNERIRNRDHFLFSVFQSSGSQIFDRLSNNVWFGETMDRLAKVNIYHAAS